MSYDSRADNQAHVDVVRRYLGQVIAELKGRAARHDASKFGPVEKPVFDRVTPKLKGLVYPSEEYFAALREGGMPECLRHHYRHNDHHPEHFENGVHDMDLLQMTEMLCDWKAAGERHEDGGDIERSIIANAERFGYGPEITRLLMNTARSMGWMS